MADSDGSPWLALDVENSADVKANGNLESDNITRLTLAHLSTRCALAKSLAFCGRSVIRRMNTFKPRWSVVTEDWILRKYSKRFSNIARTSNLF